MEEKESNIWFVMATLVVTYFLFRITHIFIIVTTPRCSAHSEFWYANHGGITLSTLFLLIFFLIGFWSYVEMFRAIKLNYTDKTATVVVTVLITIAVLGVTAIGRAQFETYDLVYGNRTHENYNFNIFPMKYVTDINRTQIDGKYRWTQCVERVSHQNNMP